MTRSYCPRIAVHLTCVAILLSFHGFGQVPPPPATVHGTIRDSQGKPVAQASVMLQRSDSRENFQVKTDTQGNYVIPTVPDGVYGLRVTKDGFADRVIPAVFLKQGESKTVDLTIAVQQAAASSPSSAPQFSDPPQFTLAGVTDTTNLGGHGSDTVVRARDSLAKDTVSLSETAVKLPPNTAREKSLREALERRPTDLVANRQLGQWLIANGRAREAIPFLERASAQDPANPENSYDLALANADAGNYAIARDAAQKLLMSHDTADLHHLLGDVEEKLGNSLEAVRHYQRAAELDPSEPHLFELGAELLLHHAPEPAAEVFARGNQLFPTSARMLLGLGAAYFARDAYDDAILRIYQSSDLNPDDPIPYQFLGKILQAQNTPSTQLVEKLHRFVMLQPQNANANYYYALGLWKLRNTAHPNTNTMQVESLLKTAIEIDPRHGSAELLLGILHSDEGNFTAAIADYRKALDADAQLEEAHYRLAQAYRQIGDSDKAKEELRICGQLMKESAQKQDRERREIKQFVYTLRDQPTTQVH